LRKKEKVTTVEKSESLLRDEIGAEALAESKGVLPLHSCGSKERRSI